MTAVYPFLPDSWRQRASGKDGPCNSELVCLASLPQPVIGGMFLAAAFLGMGQNIQRRGRLAELCYPWILGFVRGSAPPGGTAYPESRPGEHGYGPAWPNKRRNGKGSDSRNGALSSSLFAGTGCCPRRRILRSCAGVSGFLLLFTLGAAGILIGVIWMGRCSKAGYPILNLMTGTGIRAEISRTFDIIWLPFSCLHCCFPWEAFCFTEAVSAAGRRRQTAGTADSGSRHLAGKFP